VAVVRATTNKQHPYTPRSSSLSRSLQAAQDAAKAGKRGGWGLGEAGLPFFGDGPAAPTAAEAAAAAVAMAVAAAAGAAAEAGATAAAAAAAA
jgi:hypothetical protein